MIIDKSIYKQTKHKKFNNATNNFKTNKSRGVSREI